MKAGYIRTGIAARYSKTLSPLYNDFLTAVSLLSDWLHRPGFPALFAVSFLASTLLPLGSEWLLVIMLVKRFDPFAAVMVATSGNLLGALTTYLVGRYGGDLLIHRLLRISPEQQERACQQYRRYGVWSLLFSWLPVIGDPLCLAGGMLRVHPGLFTLLVGIGKLARYGAVALLTPVGE